MLHVFTVGGARGGEAGFLEVGAPDKEAEVRRHNEKERRTTVREGQARKHEQVAEVNRVPDIAIGAAQDDFAHRNKNAKRATEVQRTPNTT